MTQPTPTRGVLYIAFGDYCVAEAVHSAASVRAHNPRLATALFGDRDVPDGAFDVVRRIVPEHFRAKVDFLHESPFAQTLYLDSDTRVVGDVTDVFGLLGRFDVALAHDFARKRRRMSAVMPEYAAIPYAFPEMNGGVVLYEPQGPAAAFLRTWRERFHQYREVTNGWDQASLRVALWESGVRVATLPDEFNVRSAAVRRRVGKMSRTTEPDLLHPRILHWHGLHEPGGVLRRFSAKHRPYDY